MITVIIYDYCYHYSFISSTVFTVSRMFRAGDCSVPPGWHGTGTVSLLVVSAPVCLQMSLLLFPLH